MECSWVSGPSEDLTTEEMSALLAALLACFRQPFHLLLRDERSKKQERLEAVGSDLRTRDGHG